MTWGFPDGTASFEGEALPLEYMLGMVSRPLKSVKDIDGISLLVLFGGEDISTCWYNERPVYANAEYAPSLREQREVQLIDACIERGIPILGICRGAQFMCAYLGGRVWQHVENHARGDHKMYSTASKQEYTTNSYHHQMMVPTYEMQVLFYADWLSPSKCSEVSVMTIEDKEAEIVYHSGKKVLMIQGHPEWVDQNHDLFNLTKSLVKDLLWQ